MNETWWERPTCIICDYWWALLLVLVLGLASYFARDYWRPLLGMNPPPTPLPIPTDPPLGTGDIQVTLTWASTNDLDLWVTDPLGTTIYYQNPSSETGGQLDVDANAGCSDLTNRPVENIFWSTGGAPQGNYTVQVQYYQQCQTVAPITYHIRLLVDGQVMDYDGTIQAEGDQELITIFER